MPLKTGNKVTLTDQEGLYSIVATVDTPKTGIWMAKGDFNWEFKLKNGFDYMVIAVENKSPYIPIHTPDGRLLGFNIYNYQIDKIL